MLWLNSTVTVQNITRCALTNAYNALLSNKIINALVKQTLSSIYR